MLKRYLAEVSPTKRPASAASDARHAKPLIEHLGRYSLAALTPEIIARYRDDRLAGLDCKDAKGRPAPRPRSPNTVRLDLALLGHLYNVTIKEWGIGLSFNPVQSIRHPAPSPGRDRRLTRELNADRDVDLKLEHIENLTAIIQKHTERVATLLDASLARWLICPPDKQTGAAAQASGGKVP